MSVQTQSILAELTPALCQGRPAVVVGAGRSGRAVARLLRRLGAGVRLLEARTLDEDFALEARALGIEICLGPHLPEHFADAALVVPSPGAALASLQPLLPASPPPVLAETEVAWRCLEGEPVIGITGTSGKTTTTSLCAAMLRAHGLSVFAGGNIGAPLSEYVLARCDGAPRVDVVVLELSSFQLQTCTTLRPRVAMLLNLSENHLDYHADMDEYLAAKMQLFACQSGEDCAILPPELGDVAAGLKARRVELVLPEGEERFPYMRLLGRHNHINAEAAWRAVREFGVLEAEAARAVAAFAPIEHRLERVAERRGLLCVNDSKGTTVEALRVALQAFDRPVLLLAGGTFKGGDLESLRPLLAEKVKAVGLFGGSREIFENAWTGAVPLGWDQTLGEAMQRLIGLSAPGDVLLLAPATSSFDQYANYGQRGADFKRLVKELLP